MKLMLSQRALGGVRIRTALGASFTQRCLSASLSQRQVLQPLAASRNATHNPHNQKEYNQQRLVKIRAAKPFSDFLTDNYNRQHNYLRISITERCNLRCQYCMPEEGVELSPPENLLTTPEIIRLARLFVSQGVTKIRLTGGEPTVRKDIVDIFRQLHGIPDLREICLTSNGIALHRKLPQLAEYGLTGLNLSLDTLIDGKYTLVTRRQGLKNVLRSLQTAIDLKIPKVKINCVVMNNFNEDEILDFVELTRENNIEVRFIEYMPFDGNKWSYNKMFTYQQIVDAIREKHGSSFYKVKDAVNGETAKTWQVDNYQGKVGFITSMTENFCSTCTRLRITCDGNLKVCLFGNNEVNLKDLLRSEAYGNNDDYLLSIIGKAVKNKKEKHAGIGELEKLPNRPMILIGNSFTNLWQEKGRTNLIPPNPFSSAMVRLFSTLSSAFNSSKARESLLSHVNEKGEANMVDISQKAVTSRKAIATGVIEFSNSLPLQQIADNNNKKGDVLSTARIAGILAAKQTCNLIPLCHNILILKIKVNCTINEEKNRVEAACTVQCEGKTGVEMEALTGVNLALLTIYDMCKAVDKKMVINDVKVAEKQGGKSGNFKLVKDE